MKKIHPNASTALQGLLRDNMTIAAARPAGPPPTTTTSYCIDSRVMLGL